VLPLTLGFLRNSVNAQFAFFSSYFFQKHAKVSEEDSLTRHLQHLLLAYLRRNSTADPALLVSACSSLKTCFYAQIVRRGIALGGVCVKKTERISSYCDGALRHNTYSAQSGSASKRQLRTRNNRVNLVERGGVISIVARPLH